MLTKLRAVCIAMVAIVGSIVSVFIVRTIDATHDFSTSSKTAVSRPTLNRRSLGGALADAVGDSLEQIDVVLDPSKVAARDHNFLVQLDDDPATVVYARIVSQTGRTRASLTQEARAATQEQVDLIRAKQEKMASALKSRFRAKELYRVQRALNAIAINVDPSTIDEIKQLEGVKSVVHIQPEFPQNGSNATFLGTPKVWGNGLGLNAKGEGMRIGVIDTGIDYQHPNFGGTGLAADYQANNTTTIADGSFPTTKVVGGTDFAGDAYTGSNAAVPDPDPMDCYGHGSHVAGIAAGFGVTSSGATYAGPYDQNTSYSSLRMGPGTAPKALLYSLRVFGCSGSTNLTVQAIDWAMDPNGDNDLSDHLDVINMSLGSTFGAPSDTSAMASDNAALAGVIVVAAAGNSGDTEFIDGSPGASQRTISVAASSDDQNAGGLLTVNSPAGIAGGYAVGFNSFAPAPAPAPSGQTANIVVALDPADAAGPLTTDGCSPLTNAAAVAGNIALIDRGTCGFQIKANNAQAAGAIGVIIANNVVGDANPLGLGATGATQVTIPTLSISLADRNTILANLPANATLTAATAADTIASFSSRGPALGSPKFLKPDITAPGLNITSTQTGLTCPTGGGCITPAPGGLIAGGQALTISGTSMATPHIAGIMALLKQVHPTWSVEELKALAMNYSTHDVTLGSNAAGIAFGPARVGSGRTDPANSAVSNVVAFNGDDAGAVSVTFDIEPSTNMTATKNVRVVNKGATAVTYDLGISTSTAAPGMSFSVPNTITVGAGQSATFSVQLSATPAAMTHFKDGTLAPFQAAPTPLTSLGNLARQWLTERSGYVTFSQAGNLKMRLPVYASARPASTMSASTIVTGGAPTGSTTIPLSGTGVCTGTVGAGPTCTGTFPNDEVSLVTPFELQATSPRNLSIPASADLQYGGVAYNPSSNLLMFGVSTWGKWGSPTDVSFNVYIDTNNDGVYDRILFNSNPGTMAQDLFGSQATGQDTFITSVFNLSTSGVSTQQFINGISSAGVDSALFNNNVMVLPATPASLGITPGTPFRYKIQTCPGFEPLCGPVNGFHYDEAAGPFTFNTTAQGLNFNGALLATDLNGSTLPVTWNTANMATNGSLGALLLHHHNVSGQTAQPVLLDTAAKADLQLAYSATSLTPALSANDTLTITVINAGPNNATNVTVTDLLPPGLSYVSDDGGGSFSAGSGMWTIAALANGATATLHVITNVATTDTIVTSAQITGVTPLDSVQGNNKVQLFLNSPRSADLALQMGAAPPSVLPGAPATYTLKVTNNGGDPAYSVSINESFPTSPGLTPSSFTASQGVFVPGTGVWSIASLDKGASATLTYTVTAPNTAGLLTSQASVTSSTTDPASANNTAMASVTVQTIPTTTKVTSAPNPSVFGQVVTFTATVASVPPGGTPTGTVSFNVDGTIYCANTAINGSGVATCTVSGLPSLGVALSPHAVVVTYSGDAIFNGSLGSLTGGQAVTKAATTTTITNAADLGTSGLVNQGYAVNWSTTVVAPGAGTPTGNVTVSDGTASCTAAVAAGTCTLSSTSIGNPKTITATYSGDANFSGSTSAGVTHVVNLQISGFVSQYNGANPATPLGGATVTLSGCTGGPSQTQVSAAGTGAYAFTGQFTGTCVVSASGLGKQYDPISRTYSAIANNVTSANFSAYDPAAVPRDLKIATSFATPGQTVVVPVTLTSLGNETKAAFTVNYDINPFVAPPTVSCGAASGAGCTIVTSSTPGKVGITVTPQAGVYAAGQDEVVKLTFQTLPTSLAGTGLTFGDTPTTRSILDASGNPLFSTYTNGDIVFVRGLEGDISPRFGGDGQVLSGDVVLEREFIVGSAVADPTTNEFQRADTAPYLSKGDGQLNAADVVQTRRYAAGLELPTAAGGPFTAGGPIAQPGDTGSRATPSSRAMTVTSTNAVAGSKVSVDVTLDAAGNETAASFDVGFDAMKLSNPTVTLGGGAPADTTLTVNTADSNTGRIRVLIDSSNSFEKADAKQVVTITFDVAGSAPTGDTEVSLSNGSLSDTEATDIPVSYTSGKVTINGNSTGVTLSGRVVTPEGAGLRAAIVTLTDSKGSQRVVTTSSLGFYSFDTTLPGEYTITVASKRYRFQSRTVQASDNLADLDFVAVE